jgi:ABC-type iron transport system FetAB ATPase subunit
VLRVEHLKVRGLPPLSFEVPSGECLAIVGASGSGKTLLLRAIADLDPPDTTDTSSATGMVFVGGLERNEMPADKWRKMVRFFAAEPAWWAETARAHMPTNSVSDRLMRQLGLDVRLLDQPISRASTGERQRLGLMRGLVDEPRVLLLDEPTAALDAQSAALVEDVIHIQLRAGRSVVLVSHDDDQIERLSHAQLLLGGASKAGERGGQLDLPFGRRRGAVT